MCQDFTAEIVLSPSERQQIKVRISEGPPVSTSGNSLWLA